MRRLLRQQDGFALVLALGICVVLAISVITIVQFTTSNSDASSLGRVRVASKTLAEAGLTQAASLIHNASNASSPTLLGCSTDPNDSSKSAAPCTALSVTSPYGTSYFYGMYAPGSGNLGTWTITAWGDLPNTVAGGSDVEQSMTSTVTIEGGGQENNISVWNYVYSTAPQGSGCEVTITGTNTVVDVPLYVTGDLCLTGTNAEIIEDTADGGQAVDVEVGGTLTFGGTNSTVGTSSTPITSGVVAGGCITSGNPTAHTCSASDNWYVKSTDTFINATPPTVSFSTWYADASPGPDNRCSTSLTSSPILTSSSLDPTAFDNNTTMDGTNSSFNLTPSYAYNCVTSSGELNWNPSYSGGLGLLTVSGTIFFDGSVSISSSDAMYHGTATIYVNGSLNLSGTNVSFHAGCPSSPSTPTHQCAFTNTSSEWNPNKDLIIFVANSASSAINLTGTNVQFQGGLYCSDTSTAAFSGTNVEMEGPVICGKFSWGTRSKLLPLPTISNLPPGAPVPPDAPATFDPPVVTHG